MKKYIRNLFTFFALSIISGFALANGIGQVKTLSGQVSIERAGDPIAATIGVAVHQTDKIITGDDGSVGLLFNDDSRMSIGPNSSLALDDFRFNSSTHEGEFNVSIEQGTLSVISGKLTAKTPGALKVKTPAAILAVRGTEFSVKVDPAEK